MELSYDNMVSFMDSYFSDYNKYAGSSETLPNMLKYYTPDIKLFAYNMASPEPNNLEKILQSMLHPGLHEEFTPNYYVVDERRKIVVVQMQNQFTEEAAGKTYPAKQLSVHYHLMHDDQKNIKIYKILFFPEARSPKETNMIDLIRKYRDAMGMKQ